LDERPSIVVVGGMNVDIQAACLLPYRAGDSNPGSFSRSPGGVGRNIAENLARLGARVELVTVMGDDEYSTWLEHSCASVGIGLAAALRLQNSPASQYLCILDTDGSLAGAVAAMEAIDLLSPQRLEERAALLDSADLIMVDANVPEASILWLAARYPRGTKRPLLGFDPVSASKAARGASSLGCFAFAKPNRAEAAVLAGLAGGAGPTDAAALAGALRARGLGEAFVSLGGEGVLAEGGLEGDPEGEVERWVARIPARPGPGLEQVNLSGAGDAACAAIAWGLLGGAGLGQGSGTGERCALAVAAALIAAASASPVNPRMSAALLRETAKGIQRERLA
jgi:pseudouridine kinase